MNIVAKRKKKPVHNVQYVGSDGSNMHDTFDLKGNDIIANPPWITENREVNPKVYLIDIIPKKISEHVFLGSKVVVSVPSYFAEILQEIEESKYILGLEHNWDDEGSPSYEEPLWIKSVQFVVKYASLVWANTRKVVATPKIYHGPNGSIDLSWEGSSFNILVNIFKKDDEYFATYYGDREGSSQEVKGFFPLSDFNSSLFPMLIQL